MSVVRGGYENLVRPNANAAGELHFNPGDERYGDDELKPRGLPWREGRSVPRKTALRRLVEAFYTLAWAFFIFVVIVSIHSSNIIKRDITDAAMPTIKQPALTDEQQRGLQAMELGVRELRICIRRAALPAYLNGLYGNSQVIGFVKQSCYPGFTMRAALNGTVDQELTDTMFKIIVAQETASK